MAIVPTKMVSTTVKPTVKAEVEEKWRTSSIYPEIMVSNRGRVKEREYKRIVKDPEDGCFRIYEVPAKMIRPTVSSSGDVVVNFNSERKWTQESVAFLVAKEFVPNEDPEHYTRVKFQDKNKANTVASNLYWDGTGVWSK